MVARGIGYLGCVAILIGCGSGGSSAPGGDAADTSPGDAGSDNAVAQTVDISGWYQVTADLEGTCGATLQSTFAPAYVFVDRRVNTFIFRACPTAMDATACTGTLFYDFTQPIENGWRAEGGSAFYSAGCTLSWERTDATLIGNELRAKSLRNRTTNDLAEDACNTAAATMLTGPCTYEIDLAATRL